MAEKFQPTPGLQKRARILYPKDAEQPILAKPVRDSVHQWMAELWAEDELRAVKVKPRRSALLFGPPGCGKTTLGHHFAARLGLPLVCVQLDAVVGSFLGETGRNLAGIFDEIEGQEKRCVLFFDEFDAIASKRGVDRSGADSEMNRVVNGLLQRLEDFGGTLIAATNRVEIIDPAVWRRFGLHLDIALPGDEERFAILSRYISPMKLDEEALEFLCEATSGATPALLRNLMEGVKRDLILAKRLERDTSAASVFGRVLTSVQPHADCGRSALWDGKETMRRLVDIPWPPTWPENG